MKGVERWESMKKWKPRTNQQQGGRKRSEDTETKEKGNSNVKTTYNRLCIEGHQLTSTIQCLIIPKWHTKNKPKSTAIKSYRKRTVFFFHQQDSCTKLDRATCRVKTSRFYRIKGTHFQTESTRVPNNETWYCFELRQLKCLRTCKTGNWQPDITHT